MYSAALTADAHFQLPLRRHATDVVRDIRHSQVSANTRAKTSGLTQKMSQSVDNALCSVLMDRHAGNYYWKVVTCDAV